MANKQRLQGLITPPATSAGPAGTTQNMVYPVGPQPQPDELTLSPQASTLSTPLQEIARRFIGARRRSGEALLEAARWLHEARTIAKHGEWGVFLEATGTSDDAAERLLNIHGLAMSDQRFADAVARNWLSQSVAADLARPSTPVEALEELLDAERPPTRAEAQRVIKQARAGQNPHSADSSPRHQADDAFMQGGVRQNPHSADSAPEQRANDTTLYDNIGDSDLRLLQQAAALLTALSHRAASLPVSDATRRALEETEHAVAMIRRTLDL